MIVVSRRAHPYVLVALEARVVVSDADGNHTLRRAAWDDLHPAEAFGWSLRLLRSPLPFDFEFSRPEVRTRQLDVCRIHLYLQGILLVVVVVVLNVDDLRDGSRRRPIVHDLLLLLCL